MEFKRCDRCHKEIKRGKDEEYKVEQLYSGDAETKANKYYDLCGNCYKDFKKFIDGWNK